MIIDLRSQPKRNYFAPEYEYKLWQADIKNDGLVEEMRKVILSKEKDIICKHPNTVNDGGTGLGANSLTAKFSVFNIFTWTEPCFIEFQNWVKKEYLEFLKTLNVQTSDTYITCWANVLRAGQSIQAHWHSSNPDSYLSAHFTVCSQNTKTEYQNPFNKDKWLSINNIAGELTFFPSFLVHRTTTYLGDTERITIAMDISTKSGMDNFKNFSMPDIPQIASNYVHFMKATNEPT